MDLDVLVITENWLTGEASDQKIIDAVTPAGYSFHLAALRVSIPFHDSLNYETYLRFQDKSFETYQLIFVSGGILVHIAIINRLHPI